MTQRIVFCKNQINLLAVVFAIGCTLSALSVFGQLPTATILGTVRDSSGAVVPTANLTARNVETGATRAANSSEDGSYRFPGLPVGTYEVRAEHSGFQSEVQSGLKLAISQEAVVNFTLQVGTIEQTVAVTADAPLVDTTTSSLGSLVGEQTIADLPLNGRNFMDLTLLQPGIVQQKNLIAGSPSTVGVWYSSNGAPVRSNNYMLDGAVLTNLTSVTSASSDGNTLGIEGVREYRVVTNSFSAEYGMTMGSQVVILSKNGTNRFHGSIFEYLRNSALDARNFFDYKTPVISRRLPAFARNQFGGSVGGPIKKDRTFFFGVYEGLRQRLGVTTIDNVIAPSAKVDGGVVPQISPVIKPILALFPDANLPGNKFTYPFNQPTNDNYGQMRVDQTFSSNDMLFARYTIDDTQETDALAYPQFVTVRSSRNQYSTLSENHVFSSGILNTARFSFSRTNPFTDSPPTIIGPQYSFVTGRGIGTITIAGVTTFGPNSTAPSNNKQNIFTWSDDVFYAHGKHSLKFGTLINRYQQYILVSSNKPGTITFADLPTFLLGQPTTYQAATPGSIQDRTYHFSTLGFYVQDDFRALSNLTFNIGMRYEFMTQVNEVNGHGSALRDVQHDAAATLGPPFRNMTHKNFSPRFGFAWDVDGSGKTAVRGAFALLYDIGNFGQSLSIGGTGTPPFSSVSSVTRPATFSLPLVFPASSVGKSLRTVDYLMQQPHILDYNLAVERQLPWKVAFTLAYAGSRGINLVQTVEGNPTVPQILPDGRQFWTGTDPRTNPNWTSMEFKTAGGDSWYNSLQFGMRKQLGSGVQFQSSYTWAKLIDTTQGQATGDNTAASTFGSDPTRNKVDRGVADFDIAQTWRFNAIYQVPQYAFSNKVLGTVVGGWRVSGILSLLGGLPFTPALGTNRSRSGVNSGGAGIDRPDLLPGRNSGNIVLGGPASYYDRNAFSLPDAGFLGNAGRNILRAPGLANMDLSLVKSTSIKRLGENGNLEFRAEVFNILNRANFGLPDRTVTAGTAGVITNTNTPSRQVQFALKLLF